MSERMMSVNQTSKSEGRIFLGKCKWIGCDDDVRSDRQRVSQPGICPFVRCGCGVRGGCRWVIDDKGLVLVMTASFEGCR